MMLLNRFKNKFNLINWFKNFTNTKTPTITLGRWSYENQKRTNLKVDYANEDHCGVCAGLINPNKKDK